MDYTIIDIISLAFIKIIHLIVFLFIVLAPTSNFGSVLLLHLVSVPVLISHWLTNDHRCILTLIEHEIKGENYDANNCFTCKIIDPIYDFKNNHNERRFVIYFIVIILWLITVMKIIKLKKNKEINSIVDLILKN